MKGAGYLFVLSFSSSGGVRRIGKGSLTSAGSPLLEKENHRPACFMANPERLKPKDLAIGSRYLHANGLFIRQIDAIEGDTVIYHDQ